MMRFAEAEKQYRELEARLIRGELTEDDFLAQVAELRVIDDQGRRWMMNGTTGRWSVYDGKQWLEAQPPAEPETRPVAPPPTPARPVDLVPAGPLPTPTRPLRPARGRLLLAGLAALIFVVCLAGTGVTAWVLFLRDRGEPAAATAEVAEVAAIATYTPRPATPTYTPTFTPTPSQTPTPTITPIPTDTPVAPPATDTPVAPPATDTPAAPPTEIVVTTVPAPTEPPSPTPAPTAGPTAGSGGTVIYTVKKGDTPWDIATRFGITVAALLKANGLSSSAVLHTGQKLIIPAPGTTPAAPAPSPTRTAAPGKTPAPTATRAGPSPTAGPTATRKPTAAPTSPPRTLAGKIAFAIWNAPLGKYELYVSRIDGSGRNMIGSGFRQPQFRPDGALLAANGEGAPNLEHLVTMDASGNNKIEISEHTEDSYPAWHPGGLSVAFSSTSYDQRESRLGIVQDLLGKGWQWVPIANTEIRGSNPFWASNGRLIYHGCDFLADTSACGLYWVLENGGTYHRLTTDNSDTAPAAFGSRIAFMSSRDGNWEVYAVNMDGSGLKRLTNNGAQDGLPTWSPDGKSIAFVSNRDGGWSIWVMNADGGSQRKLFALGGGYGSGASEWTTERISWAP